MNRNVRLLVCGKKGTGKSTFSRYFINSMLNHHPVVAYIEADCGQPEFTPPGLVSFHLIDTPVFGPPFTHLRYCQNIDDSNEKEP